MMAAMLAFIGNVGYYLCLTPAIRYAGITVPALIIGTLPVSLVVYGNLRRNEIRFSRLELPALLILVGIAGINGHVYESLPANAGSWQFAAGVVLALSGLAAGLGMALPTRSGSNAMHMYLSSIGRWPSVSAVCFKVC